MGLFTGRIPAFVAPAKPEPKTRGEELIRPSVDPAPFMEACGEAALQAYTACGELIAAGKGARVNVVWPAEVLSARGQLRTGKADNSLLRAIALNLVDDLQGEAEYVSGGIDLKFDTDSAESAMLFAQPRRGAMDAGPVVLGLAAVSLIEKTATAVGMSGSRGVARSVETTLKRLLTEYELVAKVEAEEKANDDAQASADADGADME